MQHDIMSTLLSGAVAELVNENTTPCITIVIPGQNQGNFAEALPGTTLQKAIELADQFLRIQHPAPENSKLIKATGKLADSLTQADIDNGYGIYVSPHFSKLVRYNFPVEFKVKVGKGFDLRDLLYYSSWQAEYMVLSVSHKLVHLFSGFRDKLAEVKEGGFPFSYKDTYEYMRPSHGNSYSHNVVKEFEKDKSVVKDIRLKSFLRQADAALENYLKHEELLFISGGSKETADFLEITKHSKRVAGTIKGNYTNEQELARQAWLEVQTYLTDKEQLLAKDLLEEAGRGLVATGIEAVWKAAAEGKGLRLVVEKDYETSAYIRMDGTDLRLEAPSRYENYVYVEDAVEQLVRLVLEKRGRITFVNNGRLQQQQRIALQLRY